MYTQVRIHRWVLWWFYLGIICGAIALINILGRDLSPVQVKYVLALGVLHWLLGGVVCYCCGGVRIEPQAQHRKKPGQPGASQLREWHSASEFLLPGNRKSLLPPKY